MSYTANRVSDVGLRELAGALEANCTLRTLTLIGAGHWAA